jgi:hypothetical protein
MFGPGVETRRPCREHSRTQSRPFCRIGGFPQQDPVAYVQCEISQPLSLFSCRLLSSIQGKTVVFLDLDDTVGRKAIETAIKFMYGIKVLGDGGSPSPKSLIALARIAVFAEKYKITGLFEAVQEATTRTLLDCLNDEGMLDHHFCCTVYSYNKSNSDAIAIFRFATRIFGDNIGKLYSKAVFQHMLADSPRLAVDILVYVAEKQSRAENGQ